MQYFYCLSLKSLKTEFIIDVLCENRNAEVFNSTVQTVYLQDLSLIALSFFTFTMSLLIPNNGTI